MEFPDPILRFNHPTPGEEEDKGAALAAGTAREGAAQSPPATLDSTRATIVKVCGCHFFLQVSNRISQRLCHISWVLDELNWRPLSKN